MGRLQSAGAFASLVVIAGLAACVGEDAGIVPVPGPDAGTDSAQPGPLDGEEADGGDDAGSTITCTAPLEACGTACVDKQSSTQHCGRCDRACGQRSACSAGSCEPVVLTSGLDSPSAIAAGAGVIVIALEDVVVRCGKDGCAQGASRLWQSSAWTLVPGALSMSADSSRVFVLGTTTSPGFPAETNLFGVSVDAAPAPQVPMVETDGLVPSYVLGNSIRVATDAREHAFASPYRTHRCFGESCATVSVLSNGEGPTSITLTPTHYAWSLQDGTGGATVQTCERPPAGTKSYEGASDCGTPLGLAPGITRSRSDFVTSHANVVYWADWSANGGATGRVLACAPTGCNGAPKVIASGERVIDGLAVDATGAYWTNGTTGTVRVCRDLAQGCGTGSETLASGVTNPGPIVLDDTFAYFIARGGSPESGALLRVAK